MFSPWLSEEHRFMRNEEYFGPLEDLKKLVTPSGAADDIEIRRPRPDPIASEFKEGDEVECVISGLEEGHRPL